MDLKCLILNKEVEEAKTNTKITITIIIIIVIINVQQQMGVILERVEAKSISP